MNTFNRIRVGAIIVLFSMAIQAQKAPETYINPILTGFHPDPSICRVGDDYYMVNSSFEWFPGIPIYKSRDLVNWKLIGYGLTRTNQVELPEGLPDSRGIYAVSIRYNDGIFYLITTCVKCKGNFYITATDPAGEWSDPVWLGSKGIDPSLFWDDDGRCYYTGHGNITKENPWPQKNGAWMQELDLQQKKLVGKKVQLTHGHATNARWTEGPHIYKIEGKYILLVAEGGTGFHHCVSMHHSDSLWGPYVPFHSNPVLSHRQFGMKYPVHSVGHADIIQTQQGEWWMVTLGKRLVDGYSMLARETFLTPMMFEDQEGILTPVVNPGFGKLPVEAKRPGLPWTPVEQQPTRDEFNGNKLALEWNFLRTPYEKWHIQKDGKLGLRLRPEVVDSFTNPSLIARRIQHHKWSASTQISFSSKKMNEHAGMILYRSSENHFKFVKGKDEIVIIKTEKGISKKVSKVDYAAKDLVMKVEINNLEVKFYYGTDLDNLIQLGDNLDIRLLSDELSGGFNGPFVGMYASSNGLSSKSIATFDWFEYNP
ncbi:MAG: glycoside hydrolase family 43 protein [Bacteroidales bacterium]|nr:glycoside hydrolase family 43 protein [Bacteroidales bacterium]